MTLTQGLAGFILFGTLAYAQSGDHGPVFGCTIQTAPAPLVRSEGVTELIGDIVLNCKGGTPTPAGQLVPPINVSITLNTQVTSRLINQTGMSDASLMIDEPGGSIMAFNVCSFSGVTAVNPANPQPAPCIVLGNGTGVAYTGVNTNTFTGIASTNSVTWTAVPVDPTNSPTGRVLRLTNIRANAAALPAGTQTIQATVSLTNPDGSAIPVTPSKLTVGNAQPSLTWSTIPATFVNNAGTLSAIGGGPPVVTFVVNEGFPNAWKTVDGDNDTLSNPSEIVPAIQVGLSPNSESGLVIINDPPAVLGTATNPTLFQIFLDIPSGTSATFPTVVPIGPPGTSSSATASGYISWSAQVATPSGTNTTATAGSNGLYLLGRVVQSSNVTVARQFSLPITLGGVFPTAPLILVNGSASYPLGPSATSLLGKSLESPGVPVFDSDIANGPLPLNTPIVASLVDSVRATALSGIQLQSAVGFMEYGSVGVTPPVQAAIPSTLVTSLFSTGAPISGLILTNDPTTTWLKASLLQTTTPATISLTVDPTVVPSNYVATLTVTAPHQGVLEAPIAYTGSTLPWFTKWGFASSASYVNNIVAPGQQFIIFGYNFGPPSIAGPMLDANGRAVTTLANTQVKFDGNAAPLYYVENTPSYSIITGFAPFEIAGQGSTTVQVIYNDVPSDSVVIPVLDTAPALYTANASGSGQGSILNSDESINSGSNPAAAGDVVAIYGSGAGQTTPAGRDGALNGVGAPVAILNLPVKVYVDGILSPYVPYSGPAPGLVEGIFQVNFQIPTNVRHNANLPVMIQIGDKLTQPGVTVAVR